MWIMADIMFLVDQIDQVAARLASYGLPANLPEPFVTSRVLGLQLGMTLSGGGRETEQMWCLQSSPQRKASLVGTAVCLSIFLCVAGSAHTAVL